MSGADMSRANIQELGPKNGELAYSDDRAASPAVRPTFSALSHRLDQINDLIRSLDQHVLEVEELATRRARIVQQIGEAPAAVIKDAVAKVTIISSLVSDGELQVGLTDQCLDDCDLALAIDGEPEQCLKALEPDLWIACERVRNAMEEGRADSEALCAIWWREFVKSLAAISRYAAMTPIGLKAKGAIFHEVLRFASMTDGLEALQMSYMRDFCSLAQARMNGGFSAPQSILS
jgi:hypothetical protein